MTNKEEEVSQDDITYGYLEEVYDDYFLVATSSGMLNFASNINHPHILLGLLEHAKRDILDELLNGTSWSGDENL